MNPYQEKIHIYIYIKMCVGVLHLYQNPYDNVVQKYHCNIMKTASNLPMINKNALGFW